MAGEKKLRAEKLLQSSGSEKLLSVSIEALNLPKEVLNKLKNITSLDAHMNRTYVFKNIKDLLDNGRQSILAMLFKNNMRYIDADAFVVSIEQKLAKYGLKFKDSDFTVLDVFVTELEVGGKARALLNSMSSKVVTLCDLSIQNKSKLVARCSEDGLAIVKQIEKAMEKYGVKFVESSYKLDKEKFFPTQNLFSRDVQLINQNAALKQMKTETKSLAQRRKEFHSIKANNSDEALLLDISKIGLTEKCSKLLRERLCVNTVEELVKCSPTEVRLAMNGNVDAMYRLNSFLKTNSLKLKSAKRAGWKDNIKVQTVDFKNITEEDKLRVLDMHIGSLGMYASSIEMFEKLGIVKIGDLQGLNRDELKDKINNPSIMKKINYVINKFDIDMIYDKRYGSRTLDKSIDLLNLSDEEKEAIKDKPLAVLGFTKYNCKQLEDALNVKKVKDLFNYSKTEIVKAANCNTAFVAKLNRAFNQLGFSYAKPQRGRPKNVVCLDFESMSNSEKEEWKNKSIESLALPSSREKILKEKYNVKIVGDLINLPYSEVKNFRINRTAYNNVVACIYEFHPKGKMAFKKDIDSSAQNSKSRAGISLKKPAKLRIDNIDQFKLEDILKEPVSSLGVTENVQQLLKERLGIEKISDFDGKENKVVRNAINGNLVQFNIIKDYLNALGRSLTITKPVREQKISAFDGDLSNLSDEEKEKYLDLDISATGVSKHVREKLATILNVKVIRDLVGKSNADIKRAIGINAPQYSKIYNALNKLGVSLRASDNLHLPFDLENAENLSEERRREILSKSIDEIAIKPKKVQALKDRGVLTIGDFEKFSRNQIRLILTNSTSSLKYVDKLLDKLNINYRKIPCTRIKETVKIEPVNVNALTEYEKSNFLSQNIGCIGVNEHYKKILKEKLDVETIGELITKSRSELRKALNFNNKQFDMIISTLNKFNLEMTAKKKGPRENSEKQKYITKVKTTEQSTVSEIMKNKKILNLVELAAAMERRGVFALYDLDSIYFVPGTEHYEDLKEDVSSYLNKKFESTISQANSLEAIEHAENKLTRELDLFERIVQQRQLSLYKKNDGLEQKKTDAVTKVKNTISDRMKKFHHMGFAHKEEKYYYSVKRGCIQDNFGDDEMI